MAKLKSLKRASKKQRTEIKEKAFDYFWEQKTKEVIWGVVIILGIIFVPYLLGLFFVDVCGIPFMKESGKIINGFLGYWLIGLMGGGVLGVIIVISYYGLKTWIKSNKRKAYNKALGEKGYKNPYLSYDNKVIKEFEK